DKPALADYMESLTRLSLTLIESEAPDLAYIFKHAVTQEVAYNLMLFSQRRQLHQAIAEWIEKSHEDNLESYYALLAHHWTQAAERPETSQDEFAVTRAVDYLDKAGEQALQNYANAEAIQFFSQALEWETRLPKTSGRDAARERNIRRARWHSRIGFAHYGLGSLPDCEVHLREALRLLDSPLPKGNLQFMLGIFPQLFRQVLHWNIPSKFVGSIKTEQEKTVALEVARLYEFMGRIYFYSNETVPIIYTGLQFMNTAEKAGPSPELASAYSSMSVLAGIAQVHGLARTYVDRAVAISEQFAQPSNLITVGVVTSAYKITVGEWEVVRERVEKAKELCEQLGDKRQWGDCAAMLGESALLSGDIHYSMDIQNKLLDDARQRKNPLHQGWGLLGIARNDIRLGNPESAVIMLNEALQILEETPNLASSFESNSQLSLAHFRLGEDEKALLYVRKTFELIANKTPTVYSMGLGYLALADTCFGLWEKSLQNLDLKSDSAKYQTLAEKSIKHLKSFDGVFPIGKPSTPYYQGWHKWLTGNHETARRLWSESIKVSQKYRMPYEEALSHYRLGASLTKHDPSRSEHLAKAAKLFEQMGCLVELDRVQAEI
ncbi:MAG TPA: hypothetical protein VLA72_19930, partial [Anaerolineales bacterium]|nr:hypothetical protein [Anaerolineales bacterium]